MNQLYNFKRIMLLARFKFSLHKKLLFLSVMGYFALLFFIGFLIAYANRNHTDATPLFTIFHYTALPLMMGLGALVLAARSFQDMNTSEKSTIQLLIPASTFEKYIVPLVSTTILWVIVSFMIYHVFSGIFNGVWSLIFGFDFIWFNGFTILNLYMIDQIILVFFLIHSIFFLGSAAFKKYPLIKTLLAQFVIQWGYGLFALLVIFVLFGSIENFGLKMESIEDLVPQKEWILSMTEEEFEHKGRLILRILTVLLTAALYVTGYYKLKEREV